MAAAIFGSSDTHHLELLNPTWKEIFPIIENGTVDLVANYMTVTMRRDVYGVGFRTSVNKSVAWQFFDYVFNSF